MSSPGFQATKTGKEEGRHSESLLLAAKRILEMIATAASLATILDYLCGIIDAQAPRAVSAVMLTDPDGRRLWPAAGSRLPSGWIQAITPTMIGPGVGSCGAAAFLKKTVIASDIASDPFWVKYRDSALNNGLLAAWSQPLLSKNQEILGTLAMYYPEPRLPSETELRLFEEAGHLALIAIEGERSQAAIVRALEELKRSEARLRRDEEELRRITDLIPQIIFVLSPDGTALYGNRVALEYTGISAEDLSRSWVFGRVSHPEDVERLRAARRESLARGVPFELEQRILGKDGLFRWFLFRYNAFRDEQGSVIRWYVTGTDIEDRRQAQEKVQNENLALREEIDRSSMFEEIIGSSDALRRVLTEVDKVARTDSTVLILGETGTGKELIARAIHKRSDRASRAFIRVNCAAIPSSLIASELFGHEKGAFTGAFEQHMGRFEAANEGTIFLDEIGDLPPETQISLLRVLQEREIERVGSAQPIRVDVRVIAATNSDLEASVADGTFREDLFYRLNVIPIQLPALRERADDIPVLVDYLVERYARKAGKRIRRVGKNTLELFQRYDWPGNIRELQNVVERAVILCEGETFSLDETWFKREPRRRGPTVRLAAALVEHEREMIESALSEAHGQIGGASGAAARLGIPRQTLESRIKALGINKFRFKTQ